MNRYRRLLRAPGAVRAAVPALFARLAGTMAGLSILLMVAGAGRSYTTAGLVSASYFCGTAAGSPVLGRLLDRYGPASILPISGVAASASLGALALIGGDGPMASLVTSAAVAGLSNPPVGASMRALWSTLTVDEEVRHTAYVFEATLSELLFITGPSLTTLVAAVVNPPAAVVTAALLVGGGAIGYAASPAVRAIGPRPVSRARPAGTGGHLPMAAALVAIALTAALSSALAVAVAAFLQDRGQPQALTGTLVALQSVGSVIGGLVYGALSRRGTPVRRYLSLLAVLTAALAVLPAAAAVPAVAGVVVLAVLLVISGVPLARRARRNSPSSARWRRRIG